MWSPVMWMVFHRFQTSNVEVKVSKKPKGNMAGIQPLIQRVSLYSSIAIELLDEAHTLSKLQRPTLELVLVANTTRHVVLHSGRVRAGGQLPGLSRVLLAGEDSEVVVCGVDAAVTFGADGCAKEDEVFGDRRVEEDHASLQ